MAGKQVRAGLALLLLMFSAQALAQSAPPDLKPKLGSEPVNGRQAADKEKPRLQEPPRPPVAQDGVMTTAPPTATPVR